MEGRILNLPIFAEIRSIRILSEHRNLEGFWASCGRSVNYPKSCNFRWGGDYSNLQRPHPDPQNSAKSNGRALKDQTDACFGEPTYLSRP
jgi:hypothetical protein